MDDTLIRTKSGGVFAKDCNDWKLWDPVVPAKMQQLEKDGYKIVIFTNQMGISKGKTHLSDVQIKMENLAKEMNIEIQAFLAIEDDEFRKPSTIMWEVLENNNGGIKIDKAESFYCGDAAGRKSLKHKDFSDSDLKFSLNCGLKFFTPENLFLGDKEKVEVKGFNPNTIPEEGQLIVGKPDPKDVLTFIDNEMIIFVGSPGSGKSTFWKTYL